MAEYMVIDGTPRLVPPVVIEQNLRAAWYANPDQIEAQLAGRPAVTADPAPTAGPVPDDEE